MDLRDITGRAAERIKAVFSKDNRFFYGTPEQQEPVYQESPQQAPVQGAYPNQYAQAGYQQQQAPRQPYGYQQGAYQQTAAYQPVQQQPVYQQPSSRQAVYQQPGVPPYQQQYMEPDPAWQPQQAQEAPYMASPMGQPQSPQQAQLNQPYQEQPGRNRRAAQHVQTPQPGDNIVPFPGPVPEQESRQVDAYVVNITNIVGCRQAMTCLRKGQCTLVVMDQLIDKAEVRRYVDMLNGACFALGGTMTRLSLKVGFYLLAPSGMMVYTDPLTASANAPARSQPQPMPQQAYPQPGPQAYQQASAAQPPYPQQDYTQQAQPYPQQTQSPYAPPMGAAQGYYTQEAGNPQRYAQ